MEDTMDTPRGEATITGCWDVSKDTLRRRSSDCLENEAFASPPSSPMNESPCRTSPSSSTTSNRSPDSWDHRVSDVTEWSPSESVKSPTEAEPLGRHAREHKYPAAILPQLHMTRFPFGKSGGDNSEQMREELRHHATDGPQVPALTNHRHVCRWKLCGQFFHGQRQLSTHVNDDHVRVERPDLDFHCHWQGCPRLGKGFNARYKMLIHIRTHTNEKPHACPMCGKCFSRLENLKIHTRSHTGEKPYLCTFPGCGKAYSNSSDRFKHVRTHQEEKPYKCKMPGCKKQYTDPSSLRKHVRTYGHAFGLDGALSRRAPSVEDCGVFEISDNRLNGNILRELISKYPRDINTDDPSRNPEIQNSLHDKTKGKIGSFESMDDMGISSGFFKGNWGNNENGDNINTNVKNDCLSLYKQEIPPGGDNELIAKDKCSLSGKFVDFEVRCPEKNSGEIRHDTGSGLNVCTVQDIDSSVCRMEGGTGGSSSPLIGDSDVSSPAVRSHIKDCRSPPYDSHTAHDNEMEIPVSVPKVSTVSLKSTQHWKKRKILCNELEQKAAAFTTNTSIESYDPQLHSKRQSPHLLTQIEPQPHKQMEPQTPDSSTQRGNQSTHPFTKTEPQSPHLLSQEDQQSKHSSTLTSVIAHHSPNLSPNILLRPQESSDPVSPLTARHCSPDFGWSLHQLTGQNDHSCPTDSPLSSYIHSPLMSYTESPFSSHAMGTPPIEFLSASTKYRNAFSPSSLKKQSLTTPTNQNEVKCDFLSTNQNEAKCDFLAPNLLPKCPIYPMTQPSYTDPHRFLCSPSSAGSPPCVSLPVMFPLDQHSQHLAEYWGGQSVYPYMHPTSPFLCGSKFQDSVPARYLVSLTPILDMPQAISPLMERLYPVNLSHYHHHHQYYLKAMTYNPQWYATRI